MKRTKLKIIVFTILVFSISLTGCSGRNDGMPDETIYNERTGEYSIPDESIGYDNLRLHNELITLGFSEEDIDRHITNGIGLRRLYNEARFREYIDNIYNNLPVGVSGEVVSPEFYGGLFYSDEGILTVAVLEDAFEHDASLIAISEMLELGIKIKTVIFTDNMLNDTINALNQIGNDINKAGATGWWLDTMGNTVGVGLDPYTDEQIAIFLDVVSNASIDPAMLSIQPAVSQEMIDARTALVNEASHIHENRIALVGEFSASRTGITFWLENLTDFEFQHGSQWDLAYHDGNNWIPLQHLPGAGGGAWDGVLYILQSCETREYHIDWSWYFGELSPGRYMFIRTGWFGEWREGVDTVYVTVEFVVDESTPAVLP